MMIRNKNEHSGTSSNNVKIADLTELNYDYLQRQTNVVFPLVVCFRRDVLHQTRPKISSVRKLDFLFAFRVPQKSWK